MLNASTTKRAGAASTNKTLVVVVIEIELIVSIVTSHVKIVPNSKNLMLFYFLLIKIILVFICKNI